MIIKTKGVRTTISLKTEEAELLKFAQAPRCGIKVGEHITWLTLTEREELNALLKRFKEEL
jgi:hypothetical protein